MTKTSKIYESNETNLYGIIPNIGSFAALIQIDRDFEYNSSLPAQLLEECCLKGLGVSPQFVSPISLEEHYDQYNNKITIVVIKDKVPHYVIRQGQSIKDFYLTPLL